MPDKKKTLARYEMLRELKNKIDIARAVPPVFTLEEIRALSDLLSAELADK